MCSGPYPDVHSQALSRWANTGAHTQCQHFPQVRWFLTRIEESLHSTTPKKGHTWLWNFKELSACFEPVLSIKTRWTYCMCAACGSSESSQSVWSFSISLSPTAQHSCIIVSRMTSFGQSTLMEEQYWFYSTSVLHLPRLTTTDYFIHWSHHLASKVKLWTGFTHI